MTLSKKSQKKAVLATQTSKKVRSLCDYYMVYVEVAFDKHSRLVNSPAILSNRDSLVARINLHHNNLLIRSLGHTDLLQTRRRQAVLDQSLRSISILHHLDLPAGHTPQHVDVLPALTNSQAHVTLFRDENNPLQLLVNNTVLGRSASNTLKKSHVLHLLTRQLDLGLKHHFFSSTNFKTSESPASRTTIAETGNGFSQTAPRSRLDPWNV